MRILIRLVINAVAIYAAVALLNGNGLSMENSNSWVSFLWLALIFAVINALLKPVLMTLGCPIHDFNPGTGNPVGQHALVLFDRRHRQLFQRGFQYHQFLGSFLRLDHRFDCQRGLKFNLPR